MTVDGRPGEAGPPAAPERLALAAEFAPSTRAQWRELVAAVLARSGRASDDPELTLTTETFDGIPVAPLYAVSDAPYPLDALGVPGQAPFVRGTIAGADGWDVRQRHSGSDPDAVQAAIATDLANGVTSIWLDIDATGLEDLTVVLDWAALDRTPIVLDAGSDTLTAADALLANADKASLRGNLGADPIGWGHRVGAAPELSLAVAAVALAAECPLLQGIVVDGTVYHDAGASDVDELAIVTAAGVAYLRALTDAGVALESALAALEFRFAVTDDQFASIVKLRAARRMWNRVGELCAASPSARGQRQHAVTSAAMMTRRDPYVNLLRTTVAGFAAAVGGAQAITVAPFDQAIGQTDPFARRIARNTLAVLHDEVSLARVADPAGGSWYVESRTEQLAVAGWDAFTALERDGGATDLAAVAALIARSRQRRDALIADGRWPITGVNRFVDPDEQPLEREPALVGPAGGLPRVRYAEADEGGWPA